MIDNLKSIGFCEVLTLSPYGFLANEWPSTTYLPAKYIKEVRSYGDGKNEPLEYHGERVVTMDYPTIVRFNFNDEDDSTGSDKSPFCHDSSKCCFEHTGWSVMEEDKFIDTFDIGSDCIVFLEHVKIDLIKYDHPLSKLENERTVTIQASDIFYIEKVAADLVMIDGEKETDFNYSSKIWTYEHEEYLFSKFTPEEIISQIANF